MLYSRFPSLSATQGACEPKQTNQRQTEFRDPDSTLLRQCLWPGAASVPGLPDFRHTAFLFGRPPPVRLALHSHLLWESSSHPVTWGRSPPSSSPSLVIYSHVLPLFICVALSHQTKLLPRLEQVNTIPGCGGRSHVHVSQSLQPVTVSLHIAKGLHRPGDGETPGISRGGSVIIVSIYKESRGVRARKRTRNDGNRWSGRVIHFEDGGRCREQKECRRPLEARKGQELASSLKPVVGTALPTAEL